MGTKMNFCDHCGAYLRKTAKGLWCPKCNRVFRSKLTLEARADREKDSTGICVVNKSQELYAKISRTCPKCGNGEAFHWFSSISGEHAGIRRERTVEHFKCTKCSHTWSMSS